MLEQACFYRDIDGRDVEARHLRALIDGRPVAALRLFPAGTKTPARIGRVVVAKSFRGRGYARLIVAEALSEHRRLSGDAAIELSAQHHLERFYAGFGFSAVSAPYEEDGIRHVDMRRTAS